MMTRSGETTDMIYLYVLSAIGVLALCVLLYDWLVPDQSEIAPRELSCEGTLEAAESARALSANLNAPIDDFRSAN